MFEILQNKPFALEAGNLMVWVFLVPTWQYNPNEMKRMNAGGGNESSGLTEFKIALDRHRERENESIPKPKEHSRSSSAGGWWVHIDFVVREIDSV